MRIFFLIVVLLAQVFNLNAQTVIPVPSAGKIVHYDNFSSKFIKSRPLDVWLPEGYDAKQKYAVLYMYDGQNLFDSTGTWDHSEWGVDENLTTLFKNPSIKKCIVVGVQNIPDIRWFEYYPEKPYEALPLPMKTGMSSYAKMDKPQSDEYLKYIVQEVKPFVDSVFSTKKDLANTLIAGSSMGGLMSLYAICEYPDVFGSAACFSSHWIGTDPKNQFKQIPNAFVNYADTHLPDPKTHKIYFDYGSVGLDSTYEPTQKRIDAVMQKHNYDKSNWITLNFPGDGHKNEAWRRRFNTPMEFLLK